MSYRPFYRNLPYTNTTMNKNDVIDVAEKLYYERNPNTKMDVPTSAYRQVEKWKEEWEKNSRYMTLYDWIKRYKRTVEDIEEEQVKLLSRYLDHQVSMNKTLLYILVFFI